MDKPLVVVTVCNGVAEAMASAPVDILLVDYDMSDIDHFMASGIDVANLESLRRHSDMDEEDEEINEKYEDALAVVREAEEAYKRTLNSPEGFCPSCGEIAKVNEPLEFHLDRSLTVEFVCPNCKASWKASYVLCDVTKVEG